MKEIAVFGVLTIAILWAARRNKISKFPLKIKNCLLSQRQIDRYSRQLVLEGFGVEGQASLLASKVLVVGAGGLGSSVILSLAAAGVGTMGIVDGDQVSFSNLHRQTIHTEPSVGTQKVHSAIATAKSVNSDITYIAYDLFLTIDNAEPILSVYDLIIEATDCVRCKYIVNEICVKIGKPCIIAGAQGWQGQVVHCIPDQACYQCVFPRQDTLTGGSCSDNGVVGTVPALIGHWQSMLAIHHLCNSGTLQSKLYMIDLSQMQVMNIKLKRNATCQCCSSTSTIQTTSCVPKLPQVPSVTWNELLTDNLLLLESLFIDVRVSVQHRIWSVENSINIPLDALETSIDSIRLELLKRKTNTVLLFCRRGVHSRLAVEKLVVFLPNVKILNIQGGLQALHTNFVTPNY